MRYVCFLVLTVSKVKVQGQCAFGEWKTRGSVPSYNIPSPTWLQTPSIVEITAGTGKFYAFTIEAYKPTTQPPIVRYFFVIIICGGTSLFVNYQLSLHVQYPLPVLPFWNGRHI